MEIPCQATISRRERRQAERCNASITPNALAPEIIQRLHLLRNVLLPHMAASSERYILSANKLRSRMRTHPKNTLFGVRVRLTEAAGGIYIHTQLLVATTVGAVK